METQIHFLDRCKAFVQKHSRRRGVLVASLTCALAFGLWSIGQIRTPQPPPVHVGRGAGIPDLRTVGAFCLEQLPFEDVVTSQQGGIAWVSGSWSVCGDAVIGLDVEQIQVTVDDSGKRLTLRLPPPRVISARIDHDRTVAHRIRRSVFASLERETEQRTAALRTASVRLSELAQSEAEAPATRSRITDRLTRFFAAKGWSARIEWAEGRPKETQPH